MKYIKSEYEKRFLRNYFQKRITEDSVCPICTFQLKNNCRPVAGMSYFECLTRGCHFRFSPLDGTPIKGMTRRIKLHKWRAMRKWIVSSERDIRDPELKQRYELSPYGAINAMKKISGWIEMACPNQEMVMTCLKGKTHWGNTRNFVITVNRHNRGVGEIIDAMDSLPVSILQRKVLVEKYNPHHPLNIRQHKSKERHALNQKTKT